MEEMARRLVQGAGVPKDQQAGAGWLLRAAQRGSAQSAFNVGVMYERGFVVERDSTHAVEWYRKAVEANLPMAKHHLALMLREGKGAPRNGQEAVDLLRSASRQGMTASMFTLGDIYERGDDGPRIRRSRSPGSPSPPSSIARPIAAARRARQDRGATRAGAASHPVAGRPRTRTAGRPG